MNVQTITSASNVQIKAIRHLTQSNSAYKNEGKVWLEGEHLCDAFLASRTTLKVQTAVLSKTICAKWLTLVQTIAEQVFIVPDSLFNQISGLPSSGGLGLILQLPQLVNTVQQTSHTVILDQIQDAGNVGSILRSAAAFGVTQVLALQGTAALWSPKVLRAAMGAHFSLHLVENLSANDIQLSVPIIATHVHASEMLHEFQVTKKLPNPCAWVMGSEGQGVSQGLLDKASHRVRIEQLSEESLNVAAAAAVCLYASMQSRI